MRRTALARLSGFMSRSTPLARTTRIKPRRATPRRSSRVLVPDFMRIVRTLPCAAIGLPGHVCYGPIHAHHAGPRHGSNKADDTTTIPLCQCAHACWHDCNGCFAGWERDERDAFSVIKIAETQREVERRRGATAIAF